MREARMSLSASHSAMARNRKKEMSVRMEMTEEAQLVMMHRYSAEGEGGFTVWLMICEERAASVGGHCSCGVACKTPAWPG
jgi:hypothetical protein